MNEYTAMLTNINVYRNAMSDVFVPLLNVQDLAITNADVHEPNLHAELKRLNQAIIDDKHKECVSKWMLTN